MAKRTRVARRAASVNKTNVIVALMRRKGGVTRNEILEVTGWRAVSVQQIAEKANVKLRVDRKVRPFVYRAAA